MAGQLVWSAVFQILSSKLFDELATGFLPEPRNIRLFDTGRVWIDVFDTAGSDARGDRLNDLGLQLLRIFGDAVGSQFDFVARSISRLLANSRADDIFTLAFVQYTT